MKKIFKILIAALIALVLGSAVGVGSALVAYDAVASAYSVKNGPWQTSLAVGSEDASLYTRASVAVHALLALRKSETVYYTAYKDDNGDPLNSNYVYRIEGKNPDARWWSITVYGADDFLIANELNRYSYNMNNVASNADGSYTIYLSRNQRSGNWLPLGNQSKFSLSLRLYNPGSTVLDNPATVELPHIIREGAR
ncbi:MAG: DUF1214 domain-containing protein [Dehalococcoidia bacterium]|nr:DUF1214 domain-containing protein [Dehalococcoidia bacterium]MDD5494774.1 DUF1214 domain-containing protein [Dehalococcoidia bacterium]